VQFLDIVIRQAHPGPSVRTYHTFEQKLADAERFRREEGIPWPVAVDDLAGTTHQVYGGLADPTYLIDADGRVAFYNLWTSAPALYEAIEELLDRGGLGVVRGGYTRWIDPGPMTTDGWRGLRRGLPQSVTDLMWAAPGSPLLPWLGYQVRPLLAPLTLRAKPLPTAVKVGLAASGLLALALGARWALGHGQGGAQGRVEMA
jgi:hypothetical protein